MPRKQSKQKPFRPPDAAELNRMLDFVAEVMELNPREAHLALPIWRALERELKKAEEAEAIIAAAKARRLTRSAGQTATGSS